MPLRRILLSLCAFVANLALGSKVLAAPTLTRLNVRGLQSGATTTLIIDGADLLPAPRLVSSTPFSQSLKTGATATKIQIDVTVDAKVDPGFYNLWLMTDKGVSPLQVIAIDSLPQKPLGKEVDEIPVALHGNFTGSREVETTFTGKAGQRLTIEAEAQRLGGKEQPVIHLLDNAGHELALALPTSQLRGDSRLTFTLPSDGQYQVRLHDLQYAGAGPFRLKIGSWQYADIAFPPAVERGKTTQLALIGPQGVDQRVKCTPGNLALMPAPWQDAAHASGMRPVVSVSDIPELIAEKSGESPMALTGMKPPFAVSGRLSKPGEQGKFKLDVDPEAPLRLSVVAAQIGSPIDAVLEIRNEKGDLLAANDDAPGSPDPQLDFKPAKGVTSVIVVVRDADSRGSEGSVYRLIVMPAADKPGATSGSGDFDLLVEENTFTPSVSTMRLMKVIARRRGYEGKIALRIVGGPGNIALQHAEIPPGADAVLVAMVANTASTESAMTIVQLIGEGRDGDRRITRVATFEQHPLALLQPWLGNDLLVGRLDAPDIGFSADFGDLSEVKGVLAQKVTLPVRCVRPAGFDGPVRLTLWTSQVAPTVRNTVTPDPARTLRPELAKVEIAVDPKVLAANTAKTATEKALADAEGAVATATKADAALEAKVKQAADALAKAQAAPDPVVAAQKALTDAEDAAKAAKTPSAALDAKVKKAADALAKTKAAPNAKTAAEKVFADAEKALKTAKAADAALDAKVKQATDVLAKASAAADKAAELSNNSTDVIVLVPADLPPRAYDLAFKAELLARDQTTVLATYFTPVKRLNAMSPLLVKLDGTPRVEVRLDAKTGAIVKWSGKIERLEGTKGEVTIAFEDLPKSLTDQKVVVPADKSDFKVEFKIPLTAAIGPAPIFKMFATFKPDPKVATAIVRSPNIELALTVLPVKSQARVRSRIRL